MHCKNGILLKTSIKDSDELRFCYLAGVHVYSYKEPFSV